MDVVSSLRAQRGEVVEAGWSVVLRRETSADDRLLRDLQAEPTGRVLLMPLDVREMICDMHLRKDRRQLAVEHPRAEFHIVVLDGIDVGRVVLERSEQAVRVVDVTIHRDRRRRGIASAALRHVIAEAEARAVTIRVRSDDQAVLALCRQLDFAPSADADGHVTMAHAPVETAVHA